MTHAYTLARPVRVRLEEALRGLRNADACLALATFLARYQAGPANLGRAFPVDRRALSRHPDLGLTEEQVRAATAALEAVGFLVRQDLVGSPYRPTAEGLRRKPVLRTIGLAFAGLFRLVQALARRRAVAAERNRHGHGNRDMGVAVGTSSSGSPPKVTPVGIHPPMGGQPGQEPTALEAVLARWGRAVEARATGDASSGIPVS